MVQDTHLSVWVSQAQESGPSHTFKQSLYLRHCQHPSEHGVIISEPMLSKDLKQASSWWQSLHEGIDFLKLLAGVHLDVSVALTGQLGNRQLLQLS